MDWVTVFALFAEGLLSFLSPCVLPILPVYVGILAGGAGEKEESQTVLINTLFFVVGITMTFLLLAFTSSLLSRFFQANSQGCLSGRSLFCLDDSSWSWPGHFLFSKKYSFGRLIENRLFSFLSVVKWEQFWLKVDFFGILC